MEILLVLIYVSICVAIFKIFRIPVNQWSLSTAALGGIVGIFQIKRRGSSNARHRHPQSRRCKTISRTAKAEEERARLAYTSNIDGVNTSVAKLRAELSDAEFDVQCRLELTSGGHPR